MRQPRLPIMDSLPFQTVTFDDTQYKLFGIVTNMDWEGGALIHWHHERCGKSEEAHSVMKEDLAGGRLPSSLFGANAAWWWITAIAHNLNVAMKNLVKAIRFAVINISGRIVEKSRELIIRIAQGHPSYDVILNARQKIMGLAPS